MMSRKEIFFRRMKSLITPESDMDEAEQMDVVCGAQNLADQEVHEEYIKNASLKRLHSLLEGYPLEGKPWPWHAKAISEGKYPLNNLPEGVRELARTLYYEK